MHRIVVLAAGAAFVCLIASVTPARAQTDLSALYLQILQNPQDTELNLRYARAAEAQGEIQRAIAALERVIANDPENPVAREDVGRLRALIAQPETKYMVSVGALYESNMPRQNPRFDSFNDWGLYAKGSVAHERTIGARRYLFEGQVYSRYNNRYNEGALDFIGAQAAPIFYAFGGWRLTPGLGVGYARLDRDPYFGTVYLFANFDATEEQVWRQVRVRVAYDDFDNKYGLQNALVFSADTTFLWNEVFRERDQILLRPEFTLNRARASNFQFYHLGLRSIYAMPLPFEVPNVKEVTGVAFLNLNVRGYERQAGLASPGRDDYKYNPGVQVIFRDVYRPGLSVTAGYGYEKNLSRSFFNEYANHSVTVSATWRF